MLAAEAERRWQTFLHVSVADRRAHREDESQVGEGPGAWLSCGGARDHAEIRFGQEKSIEAGGRR
jgi:hypothetical protein